MNVLSIRCTMFLSDLLVQIKWQSQEGWGGGSGGLGEKWLLDIENFAKNQERGKHSIHDCMCFVTANLSSKYNIDGLFGF